MSQTYITLGYNTVAFRDTKTDEAVAEFESSNSSVSYQLEGTVISFEEPTENGAIIRTQSFPNYGVYTPIETYTDDSSGRFAREYDSSWGTHQIGFPYVGTGGTVYHDEDTEISFPSWEPVEETFEDIAKEFLYRKIKKHEEELFTEMYGTVSVWKKIEFLIDRVIFNEPATIILWKDGAKTVVKTQDGEPFDKEKGFLMAIAKYLNRDKANYNNLIKKWCPEDDKVDED